MQFEINVILALGFKASTTPKSPGMVTLDAHVTKKFRAKPGIRLSISFVTQNCKSLASFDGHVAKPGHHSGHEG